LTVSSTSGSALEVREPMIVYLCSCGFATDDPDWFDGHHDQHPDHHQRRIVRDSPASSSVPVALPVQP
jgi:hypothetical protein